MAHTVRHQLESFLREHTEGPAYVYSELTSTWGLTQLQDLAPKRPITLLLPPVHRAFRGQLAQNMDGALMFVRRDDVAVKKLTTEPDHPRLIVMCDPQGAQSARFESTATLTKGGLRSHLDKLVFNNEAYFDANLSLADVARSYRARDWQRRPLEIATTYVPAPRRVAARWLKLFHDSPDQKAALQACLNQLS